MKLTIYFRAAPGWKILLLFVSSPIMMNGNFRPAEIDQKVARPCF